VDLGERERRNMEEEVSRREDKKKRKRGSRILKTEKYPDPTIGRPRSIRGQNCLQSTAVLLRPNILQSVDRLVDRPKTVGTIKLKQVISVDRPVDRP